MAHNTGVPHAHPHAGYAPVVAAGYHARPAGQVSHQSVSKPYQGEHRSTTQSKAFGAGVAAVADSPNRLHGAKAVVAHPVAHAVAHPAVVAHPIAHAVAHPAVVAHPVAHAVAHPAVVGHGVALGHGLAHHGVVGHGLAHHGVAIGHGLAHLG